jgi:hypothetical protein
MHLQDAPQIFTFVAPDGLHGLDVDVSHDAPASHFHMRLSTHLDSCREHKGVLNSKTISGQSYLPREMMLDTIGQTPGACDRSSYA